MKIDQRLNKINNDLYNMEEGARENGMTLEEYVEWQQF